MKKLKALLRNSSVYVALELNPMHWHFNTVSYVTTGYYFNCSVFGPLSIDMYFDWASAGVEVTRTNEYAITD